MQPGANHSYQLCLFLANFLLQSTMIGVSAWLTVRLFRPQRAKLRQLVWITAIGAMIITTPASLLLRHAGLPSIAVVLPSFSNESQPLLPPVEEVSIEPAKTEHPIENIPVAAPLSVETAATEEPLDSQHDIEIATVSAPTAKGSLDQLYTGIALLWTVGIALLILRLAVGHAAIRCLLLSAHTVEDTTTLSLLARLSQQMQLHRAPRLVVSDQIQSPMLVGLFRHVVLLPDNMSEDLSPAIAHELAHIKHNDLAVRFSMEVTSSIFWLQPLMWWLSRQMRAESEFICDEWAASVCSDRTAYAQFLSQIGAQVARARLIELAGAGVGEFRSRLGQRVQSVLNSTGRLAARLPKWAVAVAATCVIILATIAGSFTFSAEEEAEKAAVARRVRELAGEYLMCAEQWPLHTKDISLLTDVEKARFILSYRHSKSFLEIESPSWEEAAQIVAEAKKDSTTWQAIWDSRSARANEVLETFWKREELLIAEAVTLGPTAIPELLRIMETAEGEIDDIGSRFAVQSWAISIIAKHPGTKNHLTRFSRSREEALRAAVAHAVTSKDDAHSLNMVTELLEDTSPAVRIAAAICISALPKSYDPPDDLKPRLVPALQKAAQDKYDTLRNNAVIALGRYGNEDSLPVLRKIAETDNHSDRLQIQTCAKNALLRIRLRTEEVPEREEGVKSSPPFPLFSLHSVRKRGWQSDTGQPAVEAHMKGSDDILWIDPLPILTVRSVESATVETNADGHSMLVLKLTDDANMIFGRCTKEHIDKRLALIFNGEVLSAPVVKSQILDGSIHIPGDFTQEEAEEMAATLNKAVEGRAKEGSDSDNSTESDSTVKSDDDLSAEPQLRFLAWQDQMINQNDLAAWYSDGELVESEDDFRLMRRHGPTRLKSTSKPQRQYLYLWFSHASIDNLTAHTTALRDATGHLIEKPMSGAGVHPSKPGHGDTGWIIVSHALEVKESVPTTVDIELRYSLGPWTSNQEQIVSPSYRGSMDLDTYVYLGSTGQTDEGKAFVSLVRDKTATADTQYNFIAITKDGNELESHTRRSGGSASLHQESFEFDVPLAEVSAFRARSRPIRTAIYRNVVLRSAASDRSDGSSPTP